MNYEQFIEKTFRGPSEAIISQAESIILDYAGQGYTLTLRQLYYQFVSRDLIPNNDKEYKRLGSIIADARLAGLLPWDGIEDRGRNMNSWLVQENVQTILSDLPRRFAADHWAKQDRYIEVWVEKEALASVVERAVMPFRVGYMACKGYLSVSEAYNAGKRMERARDEGREPLVIHLGDHDPSGIDMTRDNAARLELLSGDYVEVQRIALNRDQIARYAPPPNPAKITDSRAAEYIARHGRTSWELDALEPAVLVDLIQNAIQPHIDEDAWEDAQQLEREQKARLSGVGRHWNQVSKLVDQLEGGAA